MLGFYRALMGAGAPSLNALLRKRCARGKEDPARLAERKGIASRPRPAGRLTWIHAASVGEAQSMLAVIAALQAAGDLNVLVTTGTLNSARLMEKRLPPGAFHQFYPLDHPGWTARFLDHWRPNLVLWTESELWPVMLDGIARRRIPAALLNASLSDKAFHSWRRFPRTAAAVLRVFDLVLAQTEDDRRRFAELGARDVRLAGNLKYSAAPLPAPEASLAEFRRGLGARPAWLYASTHRGEEAMACRLHNKLQAALPGLLTVIVPRHPHRREEIAALCAAAGLASRLRGEGHAPPRPEDQIYIADTLGELGLFYRALPIACIGRSFSDDGGGGHNPIEAAQLGCCVLHGPLVGNETSIYDEMDREGAAIRLHDEADFARQLAELLGDDARQHALQAKGGHFVAQKTQVLAFVMASLQPLLNRAAFDKDKPAVAPCL